MTTRRFATPPLLMTAEGRTGVLVFLPLVQRYGYFCRRVARMHLRQCGLYWEGRGLTEVLYQLGREVDRDVFDLIHATGVFPRMLDRKRRSLQGTSPLGGMANAGDRKNALRSLIGAIAATLGAKPNRDYPEFLGSEPREFTAEQASVFSRGAAELLRGVATLIESEHARVEAEGGSPDDALRAIHEIYLDGEYLGALHSLCQDFLGSALERPIAAE
jgi:hypothetical protein